MLETQSKYNHVVKRNMFLNNAGATILPLRIIWIRELFDNRMKVNSVLTGGARIRAPDFPSNNYFKPIVKTFEEKCESFILFLDFLFT